MDQTLKYETCFQCCNSLASLGLARAIRPLLLKTYVRPIILCVGSDRVAGDSLGPMVGTMLKERHLPVFLYGTLSSPVTAHEVAYVRDFLACTHPLSPVIAVDAAVGSREDIGLIKYRAEALLPGSGANKRLGAVGDASILGIVAEKEKGFSALENARLHLVREMAEAIAEAVTIALTEHAALTIRRKRNAASQ